MAAIGCLSTLVVLAIVLTQCLSSNEGYYTYTVARQKLDDFRQKRYVDSPIPRLASDYHLRMLKESGDLDSKLKQSVVMTGNTPITVQPPKTDTTLKQEVTTENTKVLNSDPVYKPEGDFWNDSYPKDVTNNNATLEKNNITKKQKDEHIYYNSTLKVDDKLSKHYWVDMDKEEEDVIVNEMLSNSHRRAVTVKLKFDFPFYGHIVRNISIATGGFLYTGDYIHSWLAATQYIAPLMANFDTNMTKDSFVKYRDNGTAFTVEWERVLLQDSKQVGPFTFQVTLLNNGNIIFVYKDIPISVNMIHDKQHPVKVGLSDAYIIDHKIFYSRKKIIYEYHQVNFKGPEIKNWTVIYLKALPTCQSFTSCSECTSSKTSFNCKWCSVINRCSSGTDRKRQEWEHNNCDHDAIQDSAHCVFNNTSDEVVPNDMYGGKVPDVNTDIIPRLANIITHPQSQKDRDESSPMVHTGLLGMMFFVLLVLGCAVWVVYAYRNPHTQSGQFIIKYRPSQWTRRRGEARYTAASIHM